MATWHQSKSRAPLYHATKWTLVEDPPNALRTAALFTTEQEALDSPLAKRPHTYLLRPVPARPAIKSNELDTAYGRWNSGWKNL